MTRWLCEKYVGTHPIPSPEEYEEGEPLGVWECLVNDPGSHLGGYCVFVVWLVRTYGAPQAFVYWRTVHKVQGERIPSITLLLMSWGWRSLRGTLIQRLRELWAGSCATLVHAG